MGTKELIEAGKTAIGIEFGSTRIKAVMVDDKGLPIAQGGFAWENQYVDGIWTYSLDMIWKGLQDAYADLLKDVQDQYGVTIKKVGAIGFSAMMHGYMAFDKDDNLLVPFRTWRNTITEEAAAELTKEFGFNIPQRWSIAHLHQAILNKEEHVEDITFFTTLAGYIHWQLSGEKVLGVGDASGMFPIDSTTRNYNAEYLDKYSKLLAPYSFDWDIRGILPKVLVAGESAGTLSAEGAAKLDVSGNLEAGIPMCPPEGDAGTGMVAWRHPACCCTGKLRRRAWASFGHCGGGFFQHPLGDASIRRCACHGGQAGKMGGASRWAGAGAVSGKAGSHCEGIGRGS